LCDLPAIAFVTCLRSPWSNKYFPTDTGADAPFPSAGLREFEKAANDAFDTYRDLYYEGGLSSVYAWDDGKGFAVCILIHRGKLCSFLFANSRVVDGDAKSSTGAWDSIHVVQVQQMDGSAAGTRQAKYLYTLTSTVLLTLKTYVIRIFFSLVELILSYRKSETVGDFNLCGSMTRRVCWFVFHFFFLLSNLDGEGRGGC